MTSHELLRIIFDKTPPKNVATELKLSLSTVHKWGQQPGAGKSGALNPLDRVVALMKLSGDTRILAWLCQQSDGYFVYNRRGDQLRGSTVEVVSGLVQRFADTLGEIAKAAADNQILAPEADKIRTEWERLKSSMEAFVSDCESGDFKGLNKKISDQSRRKNPPVKD